MRNDPGMEGQLEDEVHRGHRIDGGDFGQETPHLSRGRSAGKHFSSSNVNTTSRAVKGVPSPTTAPRAAARNTDRLLLSRYQT